FVPNLPTKTSVHETIEALCVRWESLASSQWLRFRPSQSERVFVQQELVIARNRPSRLSAPAVQTHENTSHRIVFFTRHCLLRTPLSYISEQSLVESTFAWPLENLQFYLVIF